MYYYADSITEADGVISPVGDIPPRCVSLKYDVDATPARFVLQLHGGNTPDPAWEAKTEAEVNADYPGLVGGV